MSDIGLGFAVAVHELGVLSRGWAETAGVTRDAASGVAAGGAWAPRVSGAVTGFGRDWERDLSALAARCDSVSTRLTDTAETYLGVDDSARGYLEAAGGPR